MNGAEIMRFTLAAVPKTARELLEKAGLDMGDVDFFVFHQANKLILDSLQKKLGIPDEKFIRAYEEYGNTVSCTIPIALRDAEGQGRLFPGGLCMVLGFGVGYSWGGGLVRWEGRRAGAGAVPCGEGEI
jgi:3-oxoacyl-[acyl-carrier-protein] synthase-3